MLSPAYDTGTTGPKVNILGCRVILFSGKMSSAGIFPEDFPARTVAFSPDAVYVEKAEPRNSSAAPGRNRRPQSPGSLT